MLFFCAGFFVFLCGAIRIRQAGAWSGSLATDASRRTARSPWAPLSFASFVVGLAWRWKVANAVVKRAFDFLFCYVFCMCVFSASAKVFFQHVNCNLSFACTFLYFLHFLCVCVSFVFACFACVLHLFCMFWMCFFCVAFFCLQFDYYFSNGLRPALRIQTYDTDASNLKWHFKIDMQVQLLTVTNSYEKQIQHTQLLFAFCQTVFPLIFDCFCSCS